MVLNKVIKSECLGNYYKKCRVMVYWQIWIKAEGYMTKLYAKEQCSTTSKLVLFFFLLFFLLFRHIYMHDIYGLSKPRIPLRFFDPAFIITFQLFLDCLVPYRAELEVSK